jgi:uncharacterized protein YkwD
LRIRSILICAVASAACQSPIFIQPPGSRPAPTDAAAEVRSFTSLVNRHRQSIGCAPLQWDDQIAAVAQAHSADMARNNFFSHTNQRGQSPFDRLNAAGVKYSSAAENIAYGQTTAQQVLQSWLTSSGHRQNIETCRYTRHGVGLNATRWTHVFVGTPAR